MTNQTKDHFRFSDFLNGLFIGGILGASYVYFFHHPKGKKLFARIIKEKETIWQQIKQELEKQQLDAKGDKLNRSLKKIKSTGRKKITTFLSTHHYLPTQPPSTSK